MVPKLGKESEWPARHIDSVYNVKEAQKIYNRNCSLLADLIIHGEENLHVKRPEPSKLSEFWYWLK